MSDVGSVGWAYWDPGTLEWRLTADEPVAYYQREPVLLRSQARELSDRRLESRGRVFDARVAELIDERDRALEALATYSQALDNIAVKLRTLQRSEDGTVTAPIPDVRSADVRAAEDEPASPGFETLAEWVQRDEDDPDQDWNWRDAQ